MTEPRAGSYDDAEAQILDFHRSMVIDSARMRAYARAIMAAVSPGDVVLDIGSGTGVMAFFACLAGARRVYAVEHGPVIELARELSERNGFGDRIEFLNDWSTSVELPEPVDVVVTETIGNAAVDEGILGWAIDARTRLLRPGGLVVPQGLRLWTAAVESWDDHAIVADWSAPLFTLDYSAARERAEKMLWWVELDPGHLVSDRGLVADIDLRTVTEPMVSGRGVLTARRDATVHGLACWFDAQVGEGIRVSNAPPGEAPSWSQAYLPGPEPFPVSAGDTLTWEVNASANGERWQWSVEPTSAVPTDARAKEPERGPGSGGPCHRTARGEIDMAILQFMDGSRTIDQIVRAVIGRFPSHFADAHRARDHVAATVDDYCRSSTQPVTRRPPERKP